MSNYKNYTIFCGNVHVTTIYAKTSIEAKAYVCGIYEGFRYCGESGFKNMETGLQMFNEKGVCVFERKYA